MSEFFLPNSFFSPHFSRYPVTIGPRPFPQYRNGGSEKLIFFLSPAQAVKGEGRRAFFGFPFFPFSLPPP